MTTLQIERREGWALLTLDRPDKRNALSIELRDAMSDALDELAEDEGLHGVAVTGVGPVFSAGWDLSEFERAATDDELMQAIWASGDRWHHTLLRFPLPLVAAVNGPALAGGCDLAVCCDVRLAATTARFAHPEFAWADVLYGPFEAIVGGSVARSVLLTGQELSADDAHRVGLVAQLVEPEALPAVLDEVMARVAAAPRDALQRTKAKAIHRAGIELGDSLSL